MSQRFIKIDARRSNYSPPCSTATANPRRLTHADPEDLRMSFEPDAWMTLLNEQRRVIAAAAGVDPSKVTIHVGH